jgi:hypothetical protein
MLMANHAYLGSINVKDCVVRAGEIKANGVANLDILDLAQCVVVKFHFASSCSLRAARSV